MTIRILLAIVIIAAVIQAGVNIDGYLNKSLAEEAIREQIASAQRNLVVLEEKTAKLEAETAAGSSDLENTRSAIAVARSVVPDDQINLNQVIGEVLNLADDLRVEVNLSSTRDWSLETYEDFECRSAVLSLEATGLKTDLISFIRELPELYNTLVIDKMTVSRVDNPTTATGSISSDRLVAYLNLVIYTR